MNRALHEPSLEWYEFRTLVLAFPSMIFAIMTDQVDTWTSMANLVNLFIVLACIIARKEEHFLRICSIFFLLIGLRHVLRLGGLMITGQLISINPVINFQNFIAFASIPLDAYYAWHLYWYVFRKMNHREEPLI